MKDTSRINMRHAHIAVVLLGIAFSVLLLVSVSYASSYWIINDGVGNTVDLTLLAIKFMTVWQTICDIAYPCATVCFAFGAFKMLDGDEKKASRGKQQMLFCLYAVAALLMLPTALKVGIEIGVRYGWDPTSLV